MVGALNRCLKHERVLSACFPNRHGGTDRHHRDPYDHDVACWCVFCRLGSHRLFLFLALFLTRAGRFWFESLEYGDVVTFREYGGAVFLLNTRSQAEETIVWHKGRFATIGIDRFSHPEHFEVRRENEPVTTSGGFRMEDALAAACALVVEDLDVPQPPKPEELRLHMLNYMKGF